MSRHDSKLFGQNVYSICYPDSWASFSIVSDRGTQFTSKFWRALCQQLGITVKLSTAHHPETNGLAERANQELERYLKSHVNYLQDNWVQWLLLAEFAANNAVSESSGMTPFFVNNGFYPRLSLDLFQPTNNQEAQDLAKHINNIIEQLRANLLMSQEVQWSAIFIGFRHHFIKWKIKFGSILGIFGRKDPSGSWTTNG